MKKYRIGFLFAALLLVCILFAGCDTGYKVVNAYTVTVTEATPVTVTGATDVLAQIRPTVVDVTSYSDEATAAGSGVIVSHTTLENSEEYFIVTNHHVIEGGSSFNVDVLNIAEDGTESTTNYEAMLIGSSKKRDIAVLTIFAELGTDLPTATFIKDSDTVKVGTEVYAIGNPLGILGGTVTHGIVSATKRQVAVEEIGTMTLMQTDASINGGNSGGGLFDAHGILIGIINSGYDTYNDQSVEGLNFAIPANDAKYAVQSIIETHTVSNGKVTSYGYVKGDARLDLTLSVATLYSSSFSSSRGNYLVATVSSTNSPFYGKWGKNSKAIVSIVINGEEVDMTQSGIYELEDAANEALMNVKAGDTVTIVYRDITSGSSSFFGSQRYYIGSEDKTVTVTAEQYVYQP